MAINSRTKGNKAENLFAKLMLKWTGKKFARVPSSGGLQWKNAHAKGDIVCSEEGHYFPICVEIKNYKEINFQHLLYLKEPKILEFWAQCQRDAKICNKAGLLAMRYNRLPKELWFLIISKEIFFKFIHPYLDDSEDKYITMRFNDFVIFTSTSLMKVPYKKIRKPLKQYLKP